MAKLGLFDGDLPARGLFDTDPHRRGSFDPDLATESASERPTARRLRRRGPRRHGEPDASGTITASGGVVSLVLVTHTQAETQAGAGGRCWRRGVGRACAQQTL